MERDVRDDGLFVVDVVVMGESIVDLLGKAVGRWLMDSARSGPSGAGEK